MRGVAFVSLLLVIAARVAAGCADTDGLSGGAAAFDSGGPDAPAPDDACASAASDPDLVGYWPLDETSGTLAKDCSRFHHDGTVFSVASGGGWTVGKRGGALLADGQNGCIDLGVPADLLVEQVPFTVCAWVWVNAFGTAPQYVIGRTNNPASEGWRLSAGASDGGSVFSWSSYGSGVRQEFGSAQGQATGRWTHLAAVFAPGAKTTLFVDAVSFSGSVADPVITTAPTVSLKIGCRTSTDGGVAAYVFKGRIDEVRLYRRALSVAEIGALAQ